MKHNLQKITDWSGTEEDPQAESCLTVVFEPARMHKDGRRCNDYEWRFSQPASILAINKVRAEHSHACIPLLLMHVNTGLAVI